MVCGDFNLKIPVLYFFFLIFKKFSSVTSLFLLLHFHSFSWLELNTFWIPYIYPSWLSTLILNLCFLVNIITYFLNFAFQVNNLIFDFVQYLNLADPQIYLRTYFILFISKYTLFELLPDENPITSNQLYL